MQDICLYWMYNFAEKCFITPLALDKIYGGGIIVIKKLCRRVFIILCCRYKDIHQYGKNTGQLDIFRM